MSLLYWWVGVLTILVSSSYFQPSLFVTRHIQLEALHLHSMSKNLSTIQIQVILNLWSIMLDRTESTANENVLGFLQHPYQKSSVTRCKFFCSLICIMHVVSFCITLFHVNFQGFQNSILTIICFKMCTAPNMTIKVYSSRGF